ncbi:MAG: molybdate ABC transporter substrate-binding protein, partial [Rhizobiales bacterium]|nr:molybdate ABC transporter substrate-binding protein [Hyphomicrobiales bacterium]
MTKLTRLLALALALTLAGHPARARDAQPAGSAATATKTVVVFAAASLKNALDRIAKDWETKEGKKATLSFAASSALAKQIESGAPADLFVSADLKWMDWLAERKLIDEASRKTLLGNALVLIAPKDSAENIKIEKGFKLADALGDGRIAMGEPGSVPAGIYGKAALTSLGVWDEIAPKVAGAENVRVALAYVSRAETPFGIVYATDARSDPNVKV